MTQRSFFQPTAFVVFSFPPPQPLPSQAVPLAPPPPPPSGGPHLVTAPAAAAAAVLGGVFAVWRRMRAAPKACPCPGSDGRERFTLKVGGVLQGDGANGRHTNNGLSLFTRTQIRAATTVARC